MGFGLFLKQQGEELRNCRPGERGTQAGTGRGGRVQTVGRRPDPGKRRKQMQTGEQGEGLAETWKLGPSVAAALAPSEPSWIWGRGGEAEGE